MPSSDERLYFKARALKERTMVASAACHEAAIAHGVLQLHYVHECAACVHGRTQACADCALESLCENAIRQA
jgi:hypothetical protein